MSIESVIFIILLLVAFFLYIKINYYPEDLPPATLQQIESTKPELLMALYNAVNSEGHFICFDNNFIKQLGLNPRQFKEVMLILVRDEGRCLVHDDDANLLKDNNLRRGKRVDIRFALSHKGYHEILLSDISNNYTENHFYITNLENLILNEEVKNPFIEQNLNTILSEIYEIKSNQRRNLSQGSIDFIENLSIGLVTNALYDALKLTIHNI